ncbi:unnamed protein product, partial [Ectocarpus sp. 12 AP-2014]
MSRNCYSTQNKPQGKRINNYPIHTCKKTRSWTEKRTKADRRSEIETEARQEAAWRLVGGGGCTRHQPWSPPPPPPLPPPIVDTNDRRRCSRYPRPATLLHGILNALSLSPS